jgi:hypothetical protein
VVVVVVVVVVAVFVVVVAERSPSADDGRAHDIGPPSRRLGRSCTSPACSRRRTSPPSSHTHTPQSHGPSQPPRPQRVTSAVAHATMLRGSIADTIHTTADAAAALPAAIVASVEPGGRGREATAVAGWRE